MVSLKHRCNPDAVLVDDALGYQCKRLKLKVYAALSY
jgi:hypothetical protein